MVTINDVRYAINVKLDEKFPNIPIRGEEIKQGLIEPCFFVKLFPVAQDREVDRRYRRHHAFDIHYFPESKTDANTEMHNVADSLLDCMEYVELGEGLIRGRNMNCEIVDGVLHFFVNYDFHVMRPKPVEPSMQTMEQEANIK